MILDQLCQFKAKLTEWGCMKTMPTGESLAILLLLRELLHLLRSYYTMAFLF